MTEVPLRPQFSQDGGRLLYHPNRNPSRFLYKFVGQVVVKYFFKPRQRRPSDDVGLTVIVFRVFKDIVGQILMIHQLPYQATDRVAQTSGPSKNRRCLIEQRLGGGLRLAV